MVAAIKISTSISYNRYALLIATHFRRVTLKERHSSCRLGLLFFFQLYEFDEVAGNVQKYLLGVLYFLVILKFDIL